MMHVTELTEISLSRMSGLRWTDIVEIVLLAIVLYYILVWIKNTKAWSVLKGFFVIVAFILIAAYLDSTEYFQRSGDGRGGDFTARAAQSH